MQEIIFSAESHADVFEEAKRLGFVKTGPDGVEYIQQDGPLDIDGRYFLNYVGKVAKPSQAVAPGQELPVFEFYPGVWGRLRLSGIVGQLPLFSDKIKQYVWNDELGFWTNDGVTPAPDFVQGIAKIL